MNNSKSLDRIRLASKQYVHEKAYWLNVLKDCIHYSTKVQPDKINSVPAANYTSVEFALNETLLKRIGEVSNRSNTRLFLLLASGVFTLLKKYTGAEQLFLGTSIFEKEAKTSHANTALLMMLAINNHHTFKNILQSLNQYLQKAGNHQNYPIQALVEDLNIPNENAGEFPLFDIAVLLDSLQCTSGLQDIPNNITLVFEGAKDEELNYKEGALKGLKVIYNSNLYTRQTINALVNNFQSLLLALLNNSETAIDEVAILSKEDQLNFIASTNPSIQKTTYTNIPDVFKNQVAANSKQLAVSDDNDSLTYEDLDKRSDEVASFLMEKGIKEGDRVAILMERTVAPVITILGILKTGAVYVPLATGHPTDRINNLLERSNAKIVVYSGQRDVTHLTKQVVCYHYSILKPTGTQPVKPLRITADAPAYIIYTSGSTGLPKGVLGSHGNVLNLVAGLQKAVYAGLAGFQHVSMVAPFEFDASIQQLFGSLLQGHHLHIVPATVRMDGAALVSYYLSNNITLADGTPSHLRLMLEGTKEPIALERLSMLIAGELFPRELALAFYDHFGTACTLYNLYGPTEACVDSTYHRIEYSALVTRSVLSIGRPLFNQTMYVLDTFGAPQPAGVPGELYIGGFGVTLGYVGASASEEARFEADRFLGSGMMYRTGDVARWNAEGQLEYMGRMDRQVKLRGYRIELGEVESVLNGYEGLSRSVVVAEEGTTGEKQLNSYLVVDPLEYPVLSQLVKMECEKEGTGDYVELPNGLPMYYIDDKDIHNIYKEVFEEEIYLQEGIILSPGDTIIDIGANIGMFSLFSHLATEKACAIHAIEPITEIREVLKKNVRLHRIETKVHPYGMGEKEGASEFTFYPHSPAMSGRYGDTEKEKELLHQVIQNKHNAELSKDQVEEVTRAKLIGKIQTCIIRTLSSIIEEEKLEKIDLLKIDAEKSELDVLSGIKEEHWQLIKQIVIEVHAEGNRIEEVKTILEAKGFELGIVQDTNYGETGLYNIYGKKSFVHPQNDETTGSKIQKEDYGITRFITSLKKHLENTLPGYMIPVDFKLIDTIPLKANGKLDLQQLKEKKGVTLKRYQEEPKAVDPLELAVKEIWEELLGKEDFNRDESFFTIGGNSIKAIQLCARIFKKMGLKIHLSELFKKSTIAELTQVLKEKRKEKFEQIPKVEPKEYYRLSGAQRRFYTMQHLSNGGTSYNIPSLNKIYGELDRNRLETAFQKLIDRHEVLRTAIYTIDEPVQKVFPTVNFQIDFSDISEVEEVQKQAILSELKNGFIREFNLSEPPLLRVKLIKTEAEVHYLFIDVHHIVSDGFSHQILKNDFMKLYSGETLEPLRIHYKDYAEWQYDTSVKEHFKEQEAFWLDQFKEIPPALKLPFDFEKTNTTESIGRSYTAILDKTETHKLRAISKQDGYSMFVLLFSVYNMFLSKICNIQELVVGIPVLGRRHADLEKIIGVFINTLALRNFPNGSKSMDSFLNEVKTNFIEALENQDYQFDDLVEKVMVHRNKSGNPLFDTFFTLMDEPSKKENELEKSGLTVEVVENNKEDSKFDLALISVEAEDYIALNFQYNGALFKEDTIKKFAEYFKEITKHLIEDRNIKIAELSVAHGLEAVKTKEINIPLNF